MRRAADFEGSYEHDEDLAPGTSRPTPIAILRRRAYSDECWLGTGACSRCTRGHFFRKVISSSLVTILEQDKIPVFTVWTNAAAEMASMQPDVATWPVPSLAQLKGSALGRVNLTEYFGPGGKDIPEEWRAPLEEQFDAVLYVGPLAKITLERPEPWRCSEPAMAERLRRIRLQRPALADRVEQECVR